MKNTRGKAQELLQSLLESSPVGSLLKDDLLVGIVLSKGVNWNQVRPAATQSNKAQNSTNNSLQDCCCLYINLPQK